MILNSASAQLIERVVQQLIKLDPTANQKLSELNNKVIKVQLTDLNLDYFFRIQSLPEPQQSEDDSENFQSTPALYQMFVSVESDEKINVHMKGTSFAFFNMSLSERGGDAIFKGEVHFEGEVSTAQKFQQFWQSLDIDWEEELSRFTGDIAAHQIGNFARGFHQQAKHFFSTAQQNFTEYVQEEARMSPTAIEVDNFFEQLGDLKSDLSRIEARINKLDGGK